MRAVDQEFLVENGEIGDCVRAATASILELDLEQVPHFVRDLNGPDGTEWYQSWEKYVIENGLRPVMFSGPWDTPPKFTGYTLASGTSPRGVKHMVVMWNGELAHDPHPSRAGLEVVEAIWMLKRID